MLKKRIVIAGVAAIVCVGIFLLIFYVCTYKKSKSVNNISNKTLEEVEQYILNISSYNAELNVEVESNKNKNKYIITQEFTSPNIVCQKVKEPKNIEGLTIKYDGTNLEISNSKLNLTTIYENYNYIAENTLWLSDFINKYKINGGKITEENGIIIMEVKCTDNKQAINQKLYINRNENKISKMVIEDNNRKSKIYITYNKIEISSVNTENVVAFEKIEHVIDV